MHLQRPLVRLAGTMHSHCVNVNNNGQPRMSSSSNTRTMLSKLLDSEHKLLYDNEGWLKHCFVFVNH